MGWRRLDSPCESSTQRTTCQAQSTREEASSLTSTAEGHSSALFALCACMGAHFYSITSLFAYAGFLAVDARWTVHVDTAGFSIGVLATAVPLARVMFLSPLLWGIAADRFGRRAALTASMFILSLVSAAFAFGATAPLWVATSLRLLLGAGNGLPTLFALLCGELYGDRQAHYMSVVMSAGSVASLISPGIASVSYGLVPTYPALVPSMIGCGLGVASTCLAAHCIPETKSMSCCTPAGTCGNRSISAVADAPDVSEEQPSTSRSTLSILMTPPLPSLVVLRAACGMFAFMTNEVVPLWAIASNASGGLAYSKEKLGLMLSISAGISAGYMLINGRVVEMAGLRMSIVGAILLDALALALMPMAQHASMIIIVALVSCNQCALSLCTIAIVTSINEALTGEAERKGKLMGYVVTLEAAGKAAGPALGAPFYAWMTTAGIGPLRGSMGAFLLFSLVMCALSLTALCTLPRTQQSTKSTCSS